MKLQYKILVGFNLVAATLFALGEVPLASLICILYAVFWFSTGKIRR